MFCCFFNELEQVSFVRISLCAFQLGLGSLNILNVDTIFSTTIKGLTYHVIISYFLWLSPELGINSRRIILLTITSP